MDTDDNEDTRNVDEDLTASRALMPLSVDEVEEEEEEDIDIAAAVADVKNKKEKKKKKVAETKFVWTQEATEAMIMEWASASTTLSSAICLLKKLYFAT